MVKWRYIFHRAQGFDFISNTKWWFSDFEKNAHQFLDHFPQAWKCNIKNTYFETTNCKEYQWGHGCNLRELSRSFIRSNATIQILDDFQSVKIQEFGANVICHPQHPFEVDPKKNSFKWGYIYIYNRSVIISPVTQLLFGHQPPNMVCLLHKWPINYLIQRSKVVSTHPRAHPIGNSLSQFWKNSRTLSPLVKLLGVCSKGVLNQPLKKAIYYRDRLCHSVYNRSS